MYIDDKRFLGTITANNAIVASPDSLDLTTRSLGDGEPLALVFRVVNATGGSGYIRFGVLRGGATPNPNNDPACGMLDVDGTALGTKIRQVVVPFEVPDGEFTLQQLYGMVDSSSRGGGQFEIDVYAMPRELAKQDYLDHHEAQGVV